MGSSPEPEDHSAVPQLAPDCDLGSLPLSPAEGFLLSRVDGRTSWALLRELGGLPAGEVDRCLRRFADEGIIVLDGKPAAPEAVAGAGPDALEALLDAGLEIPLDQQRAILAFEQGLERAYHEILEVPANADLRTLRRAYFRLSKEFHPDRWFRKRLGPFADRVERVFCKISEAYELLSDPSARAEMERSLAEEPVATAPTPTPGPATARRAGSGAAPPRLSGRTTPHAFSLLARIGRERRRKARQYFAAGQEALAAERWVDAAQQLRLAIACDPSEAGYKQVFGEANRRANEVRADRYLKEADAQFQLGAYAEAYKRYVDALHCRPFDAEANHRAAKLAWRVEGDLRAAKEYAARACEVSPELAPYRKTLGQIYGAAELWLNAQRELEHALRLDPADDETRQELREAKRQARRSPRGGS
jgi:curved DNA-binding protein CbpA